MSSEPRTASEPSATNGDPRARREAVLNLRRLVGVARGKRKPLIHLQHNPDPDALGSAAALRALLQRLLGIDSSLAYTGRVGRVENRAMLRHLNIKIKPSYKIDYSEFDLILLVDTHPGAGTCRLPPGVVPDVVVDHHPSVHEMEGVAFPYYDPEFGSTSTMVGALFVENGIPMDRGVATALTYGIRTDTMDLSRGTSPMDEHIFREVYGHSDKQILSRIERARVPQEYFVVLERGLRHAQVTDFALTTYLGEINHSDSVAEIADLLFRLEGLKWVMVAGYTGETMFCSLRALAAKDVRAGEVARDISAGHGGGHDTFAAAQVPMANLLADVEAEASDGKPSSDASADVDQPAAAYGQLRERFLKAVRAKKSLTRPLTVPPDARTSGGQTS